MTAKNFIFYGFSQVMNTWAEEKGPSDVLKTFGIITMCLIGTSPFLCKFYWTSSFAMNNSLIGDIDIFGKVNRSFMYKGGVMTMLTGYKH